MKKTVRANAIVSLKMPYLLHLVRRNQSMIKCSDKPRLSMDNAAMKHKKR